MTGVEWCGQGVEKLTPAGARCGAPGRSVLLRAAIVADGASVHSAPGALLLRDGAIAAAGAPETIGVPAGAIVVDLPRDAILPALVNAHCHLDLSHIECVPYVGPFTAWLDRMRRSRATDDRGLAASVRRGVALVRRGGTALVGDVAGAASPVPAAVLREEGLPGVSFREVFGLGVRQSAAIAILRRMIAEEPLDAHGVRLGVQPHAPYSCGPDVYRAAALLPCPRSTHLAETPEEIRFARAGDGPLADFLRGLGAWDGSIPPLGAHPIDALADALGTGRFLAAHVNYAEPRHLALLAERGVAVAYCPRASAYFGHADHPYRAMRAAGVEVALGTDGRACLDTPDRISVLDEMRLLFRRDSTDPRALLRMATVAGARALGFDAAPFTLAPGPSAGVIAVALESTRADPLAAALTGSAPPRWIAAPAAAREVRP